MFETVEVGNKVSKEDYDAQAPALREALLDAQHELRQAPFSLLLVVIGDDRQGCEETVDLLNEWLDARYVTTDAADRPSDEERERPPLWRYFRSLAPRGRTTLFLGAWVLHAIGDHLRGRVGKKRLRRQLEHMQRTERMLADDGTLILKFWLHMPKKELKRRIKSAGKDQSHSWHVTDADVDIAQHYDEVTAVAEQLVRATDAAHAPWHLVESTDRRHRDLAIGNTILQALRERLDAAAVPPTPSTPATAVAPRTAAAGRSALDAVDLASTLTPDEYDARLAAAQSRLYRLQQRARERQRSTVLVFEGWDAAGKGGAIRRITGVLPARDYSVVSIAAPTEEERAHHYLWRFWRHMPRAGRMLIFDRSWYGRVLVERVEGFAQPAEWARAYDEIVDFESQLVEHGVLLLKFWLHIDQQEQLRRFQAREQTGYKRYKITDEDYRNRDKWLAYVQAVDEMVARTSFEQARWHLVPSNDKAFARVQILETVGAGLKELLG